MLLSDIIDKYFTIRPGIDNLPILARQKQKGGREALACMMNEMGCTQGVEIGINHAKSAEMWCRLIPGLKLIGIDPYITYGWRKSQEKQDAIYEEAKRKLEACGGVLWRQMSAEAASSLDDESLDFVHIDGNHRFDFVVMDLVLYVPKVKKDGLVIVHDYCQFHQAGVTKAVDAYTHCHGISPWYVTQGNMPTAFWQRGAERL